MQLATLEEQAGNPDLALDALSAALDCAGVWAATESLTNGGAAVDAQALLQKVASAVLALDARQRVPVLVLRALKWWPDLATADPSAVRRAISAHPYQPISPGLDPVLAKLGDDPPWKALIGSKREEGKSLSVDTLIAAGSLGVSLLDRRLTVALEQDDLILARAVADQLLRADRWHLRARVARLLLDPGVTKNMLTAAQIAATLSEGRSAGTVVMALDRARTAPSDAFGVRLGLAYRLWTLGLLVDAQRELTALATLAGVTPDGRATVQQLGAMVALDTGEEAATLRWAESSGAVQSPAWSSAVLDRALPSDPDRLLVPGPLARAALRVIFTPAFGPGSARMQTFWAERAALVFDDADLRRRGLDVLRLTASSTARLIDNCLRNAVVRDECAARLRLQDRWLFSDDNDNDYDRRSDSSATGDGLGAMLDRLPEIPAASLEDLASDSPEALKAIAPKLARFRTERYLGTPGFVALELAVQLARHDLAGARRTFARWGAVLPQARRLAVALTLSAPKAKGTDDGLVWPRFFPPRAAVDPLPSAPDLDDPDYNVAAAQPSEEDGDTPFEGDTAQVFSLLQGRDRAPRRALRAMMSVWKRLTGTDGAELAGWVWHLARRTKDDALEHQALARIIALAPQGEMAIRVAAETALARGDAPAARAAAARLWLSMPEWVEGATAAGLFATAWSQSLPAAAPTAPYAKWLRRLADAQPSGVFDRPARALERGLAPTGADLRVVVASRTERWRLLDLSPNINDNEFDNWWIEGRLGRLTPNQTVAFAIRSRDYLSRQTKRPPWRGLSFWLSFLAGDREGAARAMRPRNEKNSASASVDDDSEAHPTRSIRDGRQWTDPKPMLARLQILPDPILRQAIFNLFQRQQDDKAIDVPNGLVNLANAADRSPQQTDAPLLRELACMAATARHRARQGFGLCARAWAIPLHTPAVAYALAGLFADDPAAARQENVDGEEFFNQVGAAGAPVQTPALLHRKAIWLGHLRRFNEAATAELAAWLGGYNWGGNDAAAPPLEWARQRPLMARVAMASSTYDDVQRNLGIGSLALVMADRKMASAHLHWAQRDQSRRPHARSVGKDKQPLETMIDLEEIANADLDQRRLDAAGLSDTADAFLHGTLPAAVPDLKGRYPRSILVELLGATAAMLRMQPPSAATRTLLLGAFPSNVTVVQIVLAGLLVNKQFAEASALLASTKRIHPHDQRLETMSSLVTPATGPLPPWAVTATAFASAIGRVDPTPLLASGASRQDKSDQAMNAFVAHGFAPETFHPFRFTKDGLSLSASRVPRVTHCLPSACLEDMASLLLPQGYEELWAHPVRLPSGPGNEGLFRGPGGLMLVAAIPLGPNVYFLTATGAPARMEKELPALRLFRDTFQITDAALGPVRTKLLRAAPMGSTLELADGRARLMLARAAANLGGVPKDGGGCPIKERLRVINEPSARQDLLTSLFLATPVAADRARLLACATPGTEGTAALGLAGIWDVTGEANAFGRVTLEKRPREIVELLRPGLDLTSEHTAADPISDGDSLVTGVIAALTSLPRSSAQELIRQWGASGEPRLRALGAASVRWIPDALTMAEKEQVLRWSAADEVAVLAASLPMTIDGPLLDAARARMDAACQPGSMQQRNLCWALAVRIARSLDRADEGRLSKLLPALFARVSAGDSDARRIILAIEAYSAATYPSSDLSSDAHLLLARWRALGSPSSTSTAPDPGWPDLPLRARLPDRGWGYFSVGKPATFVAGLADATRGDNSAGDARATSGRQMLAMMLTNLGAEHLRESGVDTDNPFECAVSVMDQSNWVCAGGVANEAAVRQRLAAGNTRELGLGMPLFIGQMTSMIPSLNFFLPMMLPSGDGGGPSGMPGDRLTGGWLVAERVADVVHHPPFQLQRWVQLRVSGDHAVTADETLSLLSPKRLWLFSDDETARLWLQTPGRSGGDPSWLSTTSDGASGLMGAWPPAESERDLPGYTLSLDSTSQGLRIRTRTPLGSAPAAEEALTDRLPPGAAAQFHAANVAGTPIWRFHPGSASSPAATGPLPLPPPGLATPPPLWLWSAADAVAFGWYPKTAASATDRWMSVMPWSWSLLRAWKARRLTEPVSQPSSWEGALHFARRGSYLLVASDRDLLMAAIALPEKPHAAAPAPIISASASGKALADLIDNRLAVAPRGTERSDRLRTWSSLLSLVSSLQTTGTVVDGNLGSETWVRTSSNPGSTQARSSLDEWLRNQRLRNSLRLPPAAANLQPDHTVTLLLRGSSRDDVRRAFPTSDRVVVTDVDPRHFKVRILAAPAARAPAPLSTVEQRLYLQGEGAPAFAPLQATARDIAGSLRTPWDKARAVVAWVYKEMKYEITPRAIDDVTLLNTLRGDCSEYAQLTISLLRALGVPARRHEGLMTAGTTLVAHAWAEFHDGQAWHEIDPTSGRTSIDSSYVDASVIDLLPLLADGRIEITAVE